MDRPTRAPRGKQSCDRCESAGEPGGERAPGLGDGDDDDGTRFRTSRRNTGRGLARLSVAPSTSPGGPQARSLSRTQSTLARNTRREPARFVARINRSPPLASDSAFPSLKYNEKFFLSKIQFKRNFFFEKNQKKKSLSKKKTISKRCRDELGSNEPPACPRENSLKKKKNRPFSFVSITII